MRLFRITLELPLFVGWLAAVIVLGEIQIVIPVMQEIGNGTADLISNLTLPVCNNPLTIAFLYVVYWLGWLPLLIPLVVLGYLVIGSLGLGMFRSAVADAYLGRRGER